MEQKSLGGGWSDLEWGTGKGTESEEAYGIEMWLNG